MTPNDFGMEYATVTRPYVTRIICASGEILIFHSGSLARAMRKAAEIMESHDDVISVLTRDTRKWEEWAD